MTEEELQRELNRISELEIEDQIQALKAIVIALEQKLQS